jgi:undecaprenyl-diphosphatase
LGFFRRWCLGLLFGKAIKAHLFTPEVVATAFIVGGLHHFVGRTAPEGGGARGSPSVDQMTAMDA